MPITPISVSASFTSSSLNGLMIASIFFMSSHLVEDGYHQGRDASPTRRSSDHVKHALGARRRHIMAQFLFEAMTIAVSGGLVGLVTAALIEIGRAHV